MLLADFNDRAEPGRWQSIDDVVMGGQSASAMFTGDGVGVFAGRLSLERDGGFASVRRRDQPVDLSAFDVIELRLRGDGKRTKFNLRSSADFDGVVYQASFETQSAIWQTARLAFAAFVPRFRGRVAPGTLNPAHVTSLGVLISDRQAGVFRLELSTIAAAAY